MPQTLLTFLFYLICYQDIEQYVLLLFFFNLSLYSKATCLPTGPAGYP